MPRTPAPDQGSRRGRMMRRSRDPRRVRAHGTEPDPRASLANERVLLARIRATVALVVAGCSIPALAPQLPPRVGLGAAALVLALAVAVPIAGWLDWAFTERALRRGRRMRHHGVVELLTAVGVLITVGTVILGQVLR